MNTGKVVVGGLVAGVVFNVGDFVINTMLLAAENAEFMKRLGLDPAAMESFAGMAPWIVIDFLFGLLVVWTYAAIRPRFGPGVSTAVIAGIIPFLGATLVLAGFTSMGVFPVAMFVKGTAASLANTLVGTIAGAWAYTEA
ncbi:MAG: hypothetical protein A3J29_22725 [Acidobacteria bacterium RIFCSPLOWO2_12_FULL_67_14b]|nr:MAG: hypothetical protein A3J29_22725 [Acidobacteria bacterium RIFCSPLOWO2_12_FULL_67_14b]